MIFDHWQSVREIYLQGIATGQATFQTDAPLWEDWDKAHLNTGRWVVLQNGAVCGWAALSPVSSRCVYTGVAEVSIYIANDYKGQGIGKNLLRHLVAESEKDGIWTLQAGIFPENVASVTLHEQLGFRIVGVRERLAKHHGIWRDVYLLERRSPVAGMN